MTTLPQTEIPAPPPTDDVPPALPAPATPPADSADLTAVRALVPSLSALALSFLSLDPVTILWMGGTHIHSR